MRYVRALCQGLLHYCHPQYMGPGSLELSVSDDHAHQDMSTGEDSSAPRQSGMCYNSLQSDHRANSALNSALSTSQSFDRQ